LNPTIEVMDCCGNTAQISLAVNCYNDPGLALQIATVIVTKCPGDNHTDCLDICFPNQVCVLRQFENKKYNCAGVLYSDCITAAPAIDCWPGCESPPGCWSLECGGHAPAAECGTLYDERTVEMKAAGCCPMNPITGLPYD
jgi:hypothetical protein